MEEVYKNIKKRRLELGMTQKELAQLAGYENRSSIARIERGDTNLPQSKIVDIARALKVTPSYLMGWEDIDVAVQIADQEILLEKVMMLNSEHQEVLKYFVDSLLEKQKG